MINLNPTLLVIILNVNDLNIPNILRLDYKTRSRRFHSAEDVKSHKMPSLLS